MNNKTDGRRARRKGHIKFSACLRFACISILAFYAYIYDRALDSHFTAKLANVRTSEDEKTVFQNMRKWRPAIGYRLFSREGEIGMANSDGIINIDLNEIIEMEIILPTKKGIRHTLIDLGSVLPILLP